MESQGFSYNTREDREKTKPMVVWEKFSQTLLLLKMMNGTSNQECEWPLEAGKGKDTDALPRASRKKCFADTLMVAQWDPF